MPSPFPGMDPYVESPDWFPDLHGSLIIFMKGTLQRACRSPTMPSRASASGWNTRSAILNPTLKSSSRLDDHGSRLAAADLRWPSLEEGGPLVVTVETIEHGPFKQSFLEIRRRIRKEIQIVTSIEILSPANKKTGNPGREKFLEKQTRDACQRNSPGRDRPASRRCACAGRAQGSCHGPGRPV